eukprot:2084410-Rhodomonas_salina.2
MGSASACGEHQAKKVRKLSVIGTWKVAAPPPTMTSNAHAKIFAALRLGSGRAGADRVRGRPALPPPLHRLLLLHLRRPRRGTARALSRPSPSFGVTIACRRSAGVVWFFAFPLGGMVAVYGPSPPPPDAFSLPSMLPSAGLTRCQQHTPGPALTRAQLKR